MCGFLCSKGDVEPSVRGKEVNSTLTDCSVNTLENPHRKFKEKPELMYSITVCLRVHIEASE